MSKFSAKTSIPRSLNYTVTEEDRATATYYGQTLIDMRHNAKVVYPFSAANVVTNNQANFEKDTWLGVASINNKIRNNAFSAFKDDLATSLDFFNGLYTYQQSKWGSLIK